MNAIKLFLVLILCSGCSNTKHTDLSDDIAEEDVVYTINLEECLNNVKTMKLSEIADTIEFIELKTPPSIILFVADMKMSSDYIFINSKGILYQFSKDGKFIRQVGSRGQGPGEYLAVGNFFIDEKKKEIGIISMPKLHLYSFDGRFLNAYSIANYDDLFIGDSLIYGSSVPFGRETYRLTMLNNSLDTIGGIPNYNLYPVEYYIADTKVFRSPFYKYDKVLYFKGYYDNDTIWKLDNLKYKVHVSIDMGKFKSPIYEDLDLLMDKFVKKEGDFYAINRVAEDEQSIYLSCVPYWNTEMKSPTVVYDKKQQVGFVTQNEQKAYGIADDILFGPSFWPLLVTDDYYISIMEPSALLEKSAKIPNSSAAYKDFLKTIDEDKSNPILILAKRK